MHGSLSLSLYFFSPSLSLSPLSLSPSLSLSLSLSLSQQYSCKYDKSCKAATTSGIVRIPRGSETSLLAAVSSVGPVSVAIDASQRAFIVSSH